MAKLCGFPGKLGMDGSAVYPAYRAGRIEDIRRYCETDVLVCGTHFPAPSMGHIVTRDKSFWFQFMPAAQ